MSQYDLTELLMDSCGPRDIEPLIKAYHYLHRMPAGILKCFILLESNNIIPVGGAVFSNGRIQYQGKYLDFSRLWVDDRCPQNTESKFVAYCIKNLQAAFPDFEGIVTWADPNKDTLERSTRRVTLPLMDTAGLLQGTGIYSPRELSIKEATLGKKESYRCPQMHPRRDLSITSIRTHGNR